MVKKIILIVGLVLLIGLGIYTKPKSIKDIDISEYNLYHEADNYKVYESDNIDPTAYYSMIAYILEPKYNDVCVTGSFVESNYIFEYRNRYYSIREASKLGIFTCEELDTLHLLRSHAEIMD